MKYLVLIVIITFIFCSGCKHDKDVDDIRKKTSLNHNSFEDIQKNKLTEDTKTFEIESDTSGPNIAESDNDNGADNFKNDTNLNQNAQKENPQVETEKVAETPENEPKLPEISIQNKFQTSVLKATKIIIFDSDQGINKKEITDIKLIRNLINKINISRLVGEVDCYTEFYIAFYHNGKFLNALHLFYKFVSSYKNIWDEQHAQLTDESVQFIKKWIADTGFKIDESQFPSD